MKHVASVVLACGLWVGSAHAESFDGAMNVRVMGFVQRHPAFVSPVDTQTARGGFSWDWAIGAEKNWGVLLMVAGNGQDVNPVALEGELGVVLHGIGTRAGDRIGLAFGVLSPNRTVLPGARNELIVSVPADRCWHGRKPLVRDARSVTGS